MIVKKIYSYVLSLHQNKTLKKINFTILPKVLHISVLELHTILKDEINIFWIYLELFELNAIYL